MSAPRRALAEPDSGLPAPSNGDFFSDLRLPKHLGDEPRPAGRGRHPHRLPGRAKPGMTDAKTALDVVPRRSAEDVAKDSRQVSTRTAVISWFWSGLSLHARQLCELPKWDNTRRCWKRRAEPALAWTPAICRRAYERRLHRLYEWWCAKRQSRRCRADQGDGTAQKIE